MEEKEWWKKEGCMRRLREQTDGKSSATERKAAAQAILRVSGISQLTETNLRTWGCGSQTNYEV